MTTPEPAWPHTVFDTLKGAGVRHVSYVPDAGHSTLIERSIADDDMATTSNKGRFQVLQ